MRFTIDVEVRIIQVIIHIEFFLVLSVGPVAAHVVLALRAVPFAFWWCSDADAWVVEPLVGTLDKNKIKLTINLVF